MLITLPPRAYMIPSRPKPMCRHPRHDGQRAVVTPRRIAGAGAIDTRRHPTVARRSRIDCS